MSRTERLKGQVGEREVVALIRQHGWPHAERTSRGVAQKGRSDISGGPASCAIEVKRQERLNIPKAFDQLLADANAGDLPVLIHRPSRHAWMATVPADELLALLALRERA
jgi:Holliday junction resolvase